MDTDSPQAEAHSIIKANLGENGGHVAFASIEEAKGWVERETRTWRRFWTECYRRREDVVKRPV